MYDFVADGVPELAPEGPLNHARAIDTRLTNPLKNLPLGSFGPRAVNIADIERNLAFRNLVRARMVNLATGQAMAALVKSKTETLSGPLSSNEILGNDLQGLNDDLRRELTENTPLWFYVLRESELNGGKLGAVGGRIVAETFHRAIEGSAISILRDPSFRPSLGPDDSTFRMTDLLRIAYDATKGELRPLSQNAPRPANR